MREFIILRARHTFVPTGEHEYSLEVWEDGPDTGRLADLTPSEAQAVVDGRLEVLKRAGLTDLAASEVEQLKGRMAQALRGSWRYPPASLT